MKQISVKYQRGHHRQPRTQDLHDDEAYVAEIPPEDAPRVDHCHGKTDKIGIRVGGTSERDVTPASEQRDGRRRSSDVTMFPSPRRVRRGDRRPHVEIRAHRQSAHTGDQDDGYRAVEKKDLAGLPIGNENRRCNDNCSDEEGAALLEKRVDQRNVDFRWQRFVWLASSKSGTHSIPPSTDRECVKPRSTMT